MAAASFQKTSTKNSESDLEIEWMLEFDVDKKGLLRVMAKKKLPLQLVFCAIGAIVKRNNGVSYIEKVKKIFKYWNSRGFQPVPIKESMFLVLCCVAIGGEIRVVEC